MADKDKKEINITKIDDSELDEKNWPYPPKEKK